MVKIILNAGSQYITMAIASSGGRVSDLGAKNVLYPVIGLGVSCQYFITVIILWLYQRAKREHFKNVIDVTAFLVNEPE